MLSNSRTKHHLSLSTWLIDIAGIFLLLGVFYAIWIGSHPLFTPDEGRYSEVAREMITTGDYITPRLDGVAFLDKPVLYYWLQASAIKLFGLKESALRLWPALIGILNCLFVYIAGRQLFNRRTGILAALCLAVSPLYYGAAHYANLDLEVASFISMTLLCFLMASLAKSSRLRTTLFLGTYVFASLACLTKGLIGIVLPGMVAGLWILLLNRWSILKHARLFSGILVFCCITIPWYVLVQLHNPQFLHFFFVTQQFSRFLTMDTFNNQIAAWFYIPIVLIGLFPWTVFFPQIIYENLSKIWKNRQAHSTELFLVLWVFLIFIFFSIPRSKTIGYILPIFPGIALLIGNYFDIHWNDLKNKGLKFGIMAYVMMTVIIFILCVSASQITFLEMDKHLTSYAIATGVLFLISGLTVFLLKHSLKKVVSTLLITASLFALTLSASGTILNQKTAKPLALYLKTIIQPNDQVVTYYKYYQDLPIYLERRIIIVADWQASDIPRNDNWVRELWYGMPFQDTSGWLINDKDFWQRWNSQQRLFVFLNKNYFDNFQLKAQGKLYQLNQLNDIILVSNQSNEKSISSLK